jgi:hypothetical protein
MRTPLIAAAVMGLGLWLAPVASSEPAPPAPPDPCTRGACLPGGGGPREAQLPDPNQHQEPPDPCMKAFCAPNDGGSKDPGQTAATGAPPPPPPTPHGGAHRKGADE